MDKQSAPSDLVYMHRLICKNRRRDLAWLRPQNVVTAFGFQRAQSLYLSRKIVSCIPRLGETASRVHPRGWFPIGDCTATVEALLPMGRVGQSYVRRLGDCIKNGCFKEDDVFPWTVVKRMKIRALGGIKFLWWSQDTNDYFEEPEE